MNDEERRREGDPARIDHVYLGSAVRELRLRRAASQEELGYRAGLHRNYIGAVERAEVSVTFRTMLRLVGGLDVRLSELILLYESYLDEPPPGGVPVHRPRPKPPTLPDARTEAKRPVESEKMSARAAGARDLVSALIAALRAQARPVRALRLTGATRPWRRSAARRDRRQGRS